jgi:hypothetical protein
MKWFKKKDVHSEEDKLKLAKSLFFNQGVEAYQHGNFKIAHDAFAACLSEFEDLSKQEGTELRPDLARTRMNLGFCLSDEIGDYPAANIQYQV